MIVVSVEDEARLAILRDALAARGYTIEQAEGTDTAFTIRPREPEAPSASRDDERYQKLFNYAPDGILIADAKSNYLDANPAMCHMLGYTHEQLVGRHATDIVAPDEFDYIEPALETIKSKSDYKRLWNLRRKDGSIFPADVMATTLPDGTLLALVRDVSDRVAADKRIRELNRTYAVLSDVNQLIVRERDAQSVIERACQIAVKKGGFLLAWIGLKRGTAPLALAAHCGAAADTMQIVESILSENPPGCAFTVQALTTSRCSICNDIENDPLSARWRAPAMARGYRSMASFPLVINDACVGTFNLYANHTDYFDDDEVRLLEELAGDISFAMTVLERERERYELQQQLVQAQKMQAIGTLAGGIAHDFNNILMAIGGNVELARSELSASSAAMPYLLDIDRATKRAGELVNRILTFSRPNEHSPRPIQLTQVLEEATQLIRAVLPTSVELHLHSEEQLPSVSADESQIHQVVLNLVTNASHAMKSKHGRIDIELKACRVDSTLSQRHPELSPGPYVRFSVTDNGIGMNEVTQQRLFEPFFTTKPPGEGTGLGLPVVHGIVRAHHGAIVVDSVLNRGSAFHVYLPVSEEQPTFKRREPRVEQFVRGNGERILYIDDEEPLVFLVTQYLEKIGYRVTGYTNAMAALQAFRATPHAFDLIITDQNMPTLTGLEVAAEILQLRPNIPLLLTSGYIQPQEVAAARKLGINNIALKPDSITQFGALVQRLLSPTASKDSVGSHRSAADSAD